MVIEVSVLFPGQLGVYWIAKGGGRREDVLDGSFASFCRFLRWVVEAAALEMGLEGAWAFWSGLAIFCGTWLVVVVVLGVEAVLLDGGGGCAQGGVASGIAMSAAGGAGFTWPLTERFFPGIIYVLTSLGESVVVILKKQDKTQSLGVVVVANVASRHKIFIDK